MRIVICLIAANYRFTVFVFLFSRKTAAYLSSLSVGLLRNCSSLDFLQQSYILQNNTFFPLLEFLEVVKSLVFFKVFKGRGHSVSDKLVNFFNRSFQKVVFLGY